jgi:excisionase family DNA binding protein
MTDAPSGPAAPLCVPSSSRLLSLTQVAEITALSPSTLRRHIRLKRLAVHRIGGALRIAEPDLAAWLARQRRAAR